MNNTRWFGREPALVIQTISAVFAILIGFGVPWLNDNLAASITALLTAGAAVAVAINTKPIAPTAFSGLITAGATLLAAFGFNLTQQQVSLVTAGVTTLLVLLTRAQVTPVHDPAPEMVSVELAPGPMTPLMPEAVPRTPYVRPERRMMTTEDTT